MKKDVIVNKINGSLRVKNISLVEGGFITNYEGMVAIGYKAGNKNYLLSVSIEDMQSYLDALYGGWIPISSGSFPDDMMNVQVTYLGCYDHKPYCDEFAYRKEGKWHWSNDDDEVTVQITAWKKPGEPYREN